ncbi:MAG TPA: phage baseplate assembly protein V [Aggregatilineales bacterium]|nr:phage baseplate assembly protein V [Aggregatilineales bacterium]
MSITLYETGAEEREEQRGERLPYSILEGVVVSHIDLARQAKVKVRIPALDAEVWARLCAPGAGDNAGFFYTPRIDDEVLVGFSGGNIENAFVLGGLWNTNNSPPVNPDPIEIISRRVIRSGLTAELGHEIVFDDGIDQSITITTSGVTPLEQHQIKLSPTGIELSNLAGTIVIKMDNASQTISIKGVNIEIGGTETASITLKAANIEVGSATTASTAIQGVLVRIN